MLLCILELIIVLKKSCHWHVLVYRRWYIWNKTGSSKCRSSPNNTKSIQGLSFKVGSITHIVINIMGPSPSFDPLWEFFQFLKLEYWVFDMVNWKEKNDIVRTMYTRLIWFKRETRNVFTQQWLVHLFVSNYEERVHELVYLKFLAIYKGRPMLFKHLKLMSA